MNRLYVVGRADLAPGLRAAQAAHAAVAFGLEHRREFEQWGNEYLILLEVPDHRTLEVFARQVRRHVTTSEWREPDLDMELTAVALAPSEISRDLVQSLPLMHSKLPQGRLRRFLWRHFSRSSMDRAAVSNTVGVGLNPTGRASRAELDAEVM